MNSLTRLLVRSIALAVSFLTMFAGLATSPAGADTGQIDVEGAYVAYSDSADRSGAAALDGATLEPGSEVAIFVAPVDDINVRRAVFYVNGHRVKTEHVSPYDLGGTRTGGLAALVNTDHFEAGDNHIRVKLVHSHRRARSYIDASFTVASASLPTIAEVATSNPDFSTLVTALSIASENGPTDFLAAVSDPNADLTVFAPTNDAFALLGDALNDVIADPAALNAVLSMHVLGSSQSSGELLAARDVMSLSGEMLRIRARDGKVFINNAAVAVADIQTANGTIHVISKVLLPPADEPPPPPALPTIAEVATSNPDFSTLVTALSIASENGPTDFLAAVSDPHADLTVFAPTNDAFALLGDALNDVIADPDALNAVLLMHVLGSSESSGELLDAGSVTTLSGEHLRIRARDGKVFINNVMVEIADIETANGTIHVINKVILPGS